VVVLPSGSVRLARLPEESYAKLVRPPWASVIEANRPVEL
jgi:hypothetical protein